MSVPTRSPLSVAVAFLGLFAGGAAAGAGLGRLLAPGSWWAGALSAFVFPVAFALGLQSWFFLALLGACRESRDCCCAAGPVLRAP